MRHIYISLLTFVLATSTCFITPLFGQYYIELEKDASGFDTAPFQADLNAAAQELCHLLDSLGFEGQFKVFSAGFYAEQEFFKDYGYSEVFESLKAQAAAESSYYLLIGRESNSKQLFNKFRVELVLPDTGRFSCYDELSPGLSGNIELKIEVLANSTQEYIKHDPDWYAEAEKLAIDSLRSTILRFSDCCYQSKATLTCNACLFNEQEIFDFFEKEGFQKIPISIVVSKNNLRDSLNTVSVQDSNASKIVTYIYDDFSDLVINMDGQTILTDQVLSEICSTFPGNESVKGVLTDNFSFCLIDFKEKLTEMYSGEFSQYVWWHIWEYNNVAYLFMKTISKNGIVKRNLSFRCHAAFDEWYSDAYNHVYARNTILNIFNKNNFIISVDAQEKSELEWDDFTLMLRWFDFMVDAQEKSELEWDEVYNKLVQANRTLLGSTARLFTLEGVKLTSPDNYICERLVREAYDAKSTQRDYLLGWAYAHEFLHEIIMKSYSYINNSPTSATSVGLFGEMDDGHLVAIRNLNFAADGLRRIDEHIEKIVKDKDIDENGQLKSAGPVYLLCSQYLPKSNSSTISPWEKISERQIDLLTMCYVLRLMEQKYGKTSQEFILLNKEYKTKLLNNDYTKP